MNKHQRQGKSPLEQDFQKASASYSANISPLDSQSYNNGDGDIKSYNNGDGDIKSYDNEENEEHSATEIAEDARREKEAQSYEDEATRVLSDDEMKYVRRIGHYIFTAGHTQEEACALAGMNFEDFVTLAETHPVVDKIITLKELQYKHSLMRSISRAARQDHKRAEWLLERRFPEEFAKRKAKESSVGESDFFQDAVSFVQTHGDSTPIVSEESGRVPTDFAGDLAELPDAKKKLSPEEWLKQNTI